MTNYLLISCAHRFRKCTLSKLSSHQYFRQYGSNSPESSVLTMQLIKFPILFILIHSVTCSKPNWIEGIDNYLSNHPELYQVIIISDSNKSLNIPGLRDLFRRISDNRIITHASADNIDMFNEIKEDLSSTLFIYIHTPLTPGTLPSTNILNLIKDASFGRITVKYLIIHYSDAKNDYLSETLKYAWRRQMLHCTIMEILDQENRELPHTNSTIHHYNQFLDLHDTEIFIHHYNPFLDDFRTLNYSTETDLFPNRFDDMHGYPLKIGVKHNPPFSILEHNHGNITASGANANFILTLADAMNFTIKTREQVKIVQSGKDQDAFMRPLMNGQVDIYAQLYAHIAERSGFRSMRTKSVAIDEYCAVVPFVVEKHFSPPSADTVGGYLLAILIVTVFWILEKFAHLDSHYWTPFIVVKLLFGVTVKSRPRKTADRIMFGSLILVSSVYSTKLYSSLIDGMVNNEMDNKWLTLDDLADSELIPIITPLYYNKTFKGI